MQSIFVPPSIFIFHNVNTLYFFLHELPSSHQHTLKSILKNKNKDKYGISYTNSNKTKRVRIQYDTKYHAPKEDLILRNYSSKRGTRKRRP